MSFQWENPKDQENTVSVALGEEGLWISVQDEMAVDSYNSTFECSIEIPLSEARRLRDYLNEVLAEPR